MSLFEYPVKENIKNIYIFKDAINVISYPTNAVGISLKLISFMTMADVSTVSVCAKLVTRIIGTLIRIWEGRN